MDYSAEIPNSDARLIAGELSVDNAAAKFLGGQNPIEVWAASAEGINLSNLTYQDASIKAFFDEASTAYNSGTYKSVTYLPFLAE